MILLALPVPAAPAAAGPAAPAVARGPEAAVAAEIARRADGALKRFYRERGFRPLWAADGRFGPAAAALLGYLETADADGLDPSDYRPDDAREAVAAAAAPGDPRAVAGAELLLSRAFARYVRDQRRSRVRMIWADPALKPRRPAPDAVLRAAALRPSLAAYVADMAWMSPQYVRLRTLAAAAGDAPPEARERLGLNLDRARLLPGPWTAHVLVDASSGQLWYYDAGR